MAIDPRIALGVQPVQLQDPTNQLAKMLEIQGAQDNRKINMLTLRDKERSMADEDQMRDFTRQAGGDMGRLRDLVYGAGNYKQGMALDKTIADRKTAELAQRKAALEEDLKNFEVAGQIMAPVRDQAGWEVARQQTAQVFGPDAAAQMPLQYDPRLVEQKRLQAMSIKDQVAAEHQKLVLAETGRHNRTTEGLTARGQDKTDMRARDFNETKVEENRLKREAKDETSKLTRSSQLASFETMLGTLDRLGTHPGLARSVGAVGAFPTMPGSDSANFQAELNTFQSQAFLPMVAQLKGMGALSDAEGKKLTAAVGALDPKMGEQAFRDSVARIKADMQAAYERMGGAPQRRESGGATGSWGDTAAPSEPISIKTAAEYANIPIGATYIDPNGQMRTKK